jgi:hypothetical protein
MVDENLQNTVVHDVGQSFNNHIHTAPLLIVENYLAYL